MYPQLTDPDQAWSAVRYPPLHIPTPRRGKVDDEIGGTRWMGRPPLLTDSELVCLAVAQALCAGPGSGTPLAQRDGEAFQVCAHAVSSTGLLGIATAATCFGVVLGRFRGRGRLGR